MEADLAKTKTLGVAEADADDISAWVSKSRESEAEAKRAAERAAAAKMASMYDEEVSKLQLVSSLTGVKILPTTESFGGLVDFNWHAFTLEGVSGRHCQMCVHSSTVAKHAPPPM